MKDRKAYKRKRYLENKAALNAWQRDYMRRTKDQRMSYQKTFVKSYRQTIKGRFVEYKCNAKSRGHLFTITLEDFTTFWQKPCYYCGDEISLVGIDRLDNSKGYSADNIVSCCEQCNFAKGNLSKEDFIKVCRKVAIKHPTL